MTCRTWKYHRIIRTAYQFWCLKFPTMKRPIWPLLSRIKPTIFPKQHRTLGTTSTMMAVVGVGVSIFEVASCYSRKQGIYY